MDWNVQKKRMQQRIKRLEEKLRERAAGEVPEDFLLRSQEVRATLTDALTLLAVAVRRHPDDAWAKRAKELAPDLESHLPCPGYFGDPSCCEFHAHSLRCGDPSEVCRECGTTNDEHRKAWAKLE